MATKGRIITSGLEQEYKKSTRPVMDNTGKRALGRILQGQIAQGSSTSIVEPFFTPWTQRTTIEIPTQYKELVKWRRYFYNNEPLVSSACELHSQFPLSTFYVEHADKKISVDFERMCENMEMFEFLLEMLLEFWVTGEAIPFGFLNDVEDPHYWTDFVLLDPTSVDIQWDPIARGKKKEVIKLEPSKVVQQIVNDGSQDKDTGELYKNLPQDIIEAVKKGEKLNLNSMQVSHIKRPGSYHNIRGTSIIDRCFKQLMYRDKLRSAQYTIADRHICYDVETECLTKEGFKKYNELTKEDEIATVNKDTGIFEYQKSSKITILKHDGDMCHFNKQKLDIMVTPDHRMLVKKLKYVKEGKRKTNKEYEYGEWESCPAKDVKFSYKFRGVVDDFKGSISSDYVILNLKKQINKSANFTNSKRECFETNEVKIPIEQYLKFIGFWISEGSFSCPIGEYAQKRIVVYQSKNSTQYKEFEDFFDNEFILKFTKNTNKEGTTTWGMASDVLFDHLISNYGLHCYEKHIAIWVKNLPRKYLKILIDAMILGDGSDVTECTFEGKVYPQKYRRYYTTSPQLGSDVQEIVFKSGYAPILNIKKPAITSTIHCKPVYDVHWSETTEFGRFPVLAKHRKDETVYDTIPYNNDVWCVTVPNGIFITRRHGKIAIQFNCPREFYYIGSDAEPASQEELDAFKDLLMAQWSSPNSAIVYHHAVRAEWLGANGSILPLQPEFAYIDKQLAIALLINEGIVTAATQPYASTSVALDVMIQRYLIVRMRVQNWLENKVFKPVCQMNKIIKRTKVELEYGIRFNSNEPEYDVPKIRWDKEDMRNDSNKIAMLIGLAEKFWIPKSMILEKLDIDPEEAKNGLEKEKAESSGMGAPPPLPGSAPGSMGGMLGEAPPQNEPIPEGESMGLPEGPPPEGFPPESAEALEGGGGLPSAIT